MHFPEVEVESVASLASLNGWWSFLREAQWPPRSTSTDSVVWNGKSRRVERFVEFRGLELRVSRFQSNGPGKSVSSETWATFVMLRLGIHSTTPRIFPLTRSLRRHLHVDYEFKYSEKLQKRAQE